MVEMNVGLATFLMFFLLFILLATGLPIAFVLGSVTVIFTYLLNVQHFGTLDLK